MNTLCAKNSDGLVLIVLFYDYIASIDGRIDKDLEGKPRSMRRCIVITSLDSLVSRCFPSNRASCDIHVCNGRILMNRENLLGHHLNGIDLSMLKWWNVMNYPNWSTIYDDIRLNSGNASWCLIQNLVLSERNNLNNTIISVVYCCNILLLNY
jgi:hypothetical protein